MSLTLDQTPHQPAPGAIPNAVVAFRNVSISFTGPQVLDNISFTVAPGETRILLGPAGVGKSVLLKLANGLLIPDSAITSQQSDQVVFVVGADNKVRQVKVTTGPIVDGLRVITSGLSANDEVVINAIQRAKSGAVVTPKPEQIKAPNPGASPTPADLAPPPASATFDASP